LALAINEKHQADFPNATVDDDDAITSFESQDGQQYFSYSTISFL